MISLPHTVITEGSASGIIEYLDYARRDDSIKAVVIKLNTPGGSASASERLYIETRRLREEKPVVIVMGDLVASGGYMMSMGASYSYAQAASLVGNVGVISTAGQLVPDLPDETTVFSRPRKLDGGTRRQWVGTVDLLAAAFAQLVVAERGDRLRISRDELMEARLYPGMVAVRLGLADEVGGDIDGIRKAARLAGISNYGFVDVNFEVMRERIQRLDEILPSGNDSGIAALLSGTSDGAGAESGGGIARLLALQELMAPSDLDSGGEDPFPELPLDLNRPNIYYLYVGRGP